MSFWVLRRWKPVTTILQCTFYWLILCTCYYSISIMADLEAGKYSHTFSKFSAVWILIWESNRSLGVPNFTHFQVTPPPPHTKNSRLAHICICMHFSLQYLILAMTYLKLSEGGGNAPNPIVIHAIPSIRPSRNKPMSGFREGLSASCTLNLCRRHSAMSKTHVSITQIK